MHKLTSLVNFDHFSSIIFQVGQRFHKENLEIAKHPKRKALSFSIRSN